ncbi:MAG TPA: alkaline phosphatase family protein [Chloroflexota bacterium]
MHRLGWRASVSVGAVLLALALVFPAVEFTRARLDAPERASGGASRLYDHVFLIVEENGEASTILDNARLPTLNALADQYGLATQYFATIHPSEGNYVAMLGGDSYNIRDDDSYRTHAVEQPSVLDQLDEAGLTWGGYFQAQPSAGFDGDCYPRDDLCLYASKHNGFLNFVSVQERADQRARLRPDSQLGPDLVTGAAPNVAVIVPDQCHDLHGLPGVCSGDSMRWQTDAYLKATIDEIMSSQMWQTGRNAIVITFDEGGTDQGCCGTDPGGGKVVAVVVRNGAPERIRDDTPYNHYALAATLQRAFGLGCQFHGQPVGRTCDASSGIRPMAPLFGLQATD